MKLQRPTLSESSDSSDTATETQIQEAVAETITESNDKVVEIKPASESKGGSKLSMLAIVGAVIGVGYWLRKSKQPTEAIQSATTQTADRTKQVTEQAADTIQESGEMVADRVEEGSEMASERVEQKGEKAAEGAEEAGEMAADKASESGSSSDDS